MNLFQKCDMCGVAYAISELRKANPYTDHQHCPRCWNYSNGSHPNQWEYIENEQ